MEFSLGLTYVINGVFNLLNNNTLFGFTYIDMFMSTAFVAFVVHLVHMRTIHN